LHTNQPALLDHILDRLDLRELVITEGILDQLDHSGVRPLYGGKLGIDVTTKTLEERLPESGSGRFAANERCAALAEDWKKTLLESGIVVRYSRLYGQA